MVSGHNLLVRAWELRRQMVSLYWEQGVVECGLTGAESLGHALMGPGCAKQLRFVATEASPLSCASPPQNK